MGFCRVPECTIAERSAARMMGMLRFMSLTTATQLCLVINQLALLPLQLRVWGHDATAQWFVVIAVGNLATMADLGLRNAGHAQLLSSVETGDAAAALEFRQIWALTRALFIGLTTALLAAQILAALHSGMAFSLWVWTVTVSLALDTAIIVRGIWLETLGYLNKVEGVFLAMAASRVLICIAALIAFRASPSVLGWIMLATAVGATLAQARILRNPNSLGLLRGGFGDLRWRSLRVVRFVVAEPAVSWVRLSLPVVVLATVSTPLMVTTYVALRAVFGLARQVIIQLARYASVGYVQCVDGDRLAAERFVIRSLLISTIVGVAVSSATIADRGRLLSFWLTASDPATVSLVALSFAIGATAYGYQVIAGVLIRSGQVVSVAKRQYAYLFASGMGAAATLLSGSAALYLVLLGSLELMIAALFVPALGVRVLRASVAAFVAAASSLGLLCAAVELDPGKLFSTVTPAAIAASLALAALTTIFALAACLFVASSPLRRLRSLSSLWRISNVNS